MGLFPPWFFDTWTPKKLPGLQLWLRADQGVYQDSALTTPAGVDGDPAGGWRDQSGRGHHATQATAGKRPALKQSIVHGRSVLRFDGVDDVLQTAANALPTGNADFTIMVVCATSTTGAKPVIHYGGTTTRTGPHLIPLAATTTFRYSDFGDTIDTTTTNRSGVWTLGLVRYTASTLGAEVIVPSAAGASNSATLGGTPNWGSTAVNIGQFSNDTSQFTGDVAEIIAVNRAISNAERQAASRYLGTRYGLAVTV